MSCWPAPAAEARLVPAAAPRPLPVLWQVNARTTVERIGPGATLADLDDDLLDRLVPPEADWVYLLGVWQTGAAGRTVSRRDPAIRRSCADALSDLTDDDICGSCFAVTGWRVHEALGGDGALAMLRRRLVRRGIRLMLDFVPNHTALDHPWVATNPEYYVAGTDADLAAAPTDWIRVATGGGEVVLAHGRDPYFPGWPDTLQLDYSLAAVQGAMTEQLLLAADRCDGLRCDMAMLLLPDVFEQTWGRPIESFWPTALAQVRAAHPGFTFMAEVYWDRERDLQQQGFDVTYDKRLYDRLVGGEASAVRDHLRADVDFQSRSARFVENHDEPRAAATFGTGDRHRAAAVVTYLTPGLRFFEDGQREARRIHVPVHLCRAPREADGGELADFYDELLAVLDDPVVHDGVWQLCDVRSAWDGNASEQRLIAWTWSTDEGALRFVIVVNLADNWSQGYVQLTTPSLAGRRIVIEDRLGDERHERDGDELIRSGLFVDVAPWAHHVFAVTLADT